MAIWYFIYEIYKSCLYVKYKYNSLILVIFLHVGILF